jgi:hypothetical protein
MYQTLLAFIRTFHSNETIIWARIQVMLGAAWLAVSAADLTPIIVNPKYVAYWTIVNGFISEMLRRSRAEFSPADDKDSK